MSKLGHELKDEVLAEKLAAAGLRNPAQVKKAGDADLRAIVGEAGLAKVRAVFPKAKKAK